MLISTQGFPVRKIDDMWSSHWVRQLLLISSCKRIQCKWRKESDLRHWRCLACLPTFEVKGKIVYIVVFYFLHMEILGYESVIWTYAWIVFQIGNRGAVTQAPDFDAEIDMEKLRAAMKGAGEEQMRGRENTSRLLFIHHQVFAFVYFNHQNSTLKN